MLNDVVEVKVQGVLPTAGGCAIFLGNDEKSFVIYVDKMIGSYISMSLNEIKSERPLTHDLLNSIFSGFGIDVDRIIINDVDNGTFFARLILKMTNETATKILEADARPSDSIIIALNRKKPIYVRREVLDSVDDMKGILQKIKEGKEGKESEDQGYNPEL